MIGARDFGAQGYHAQPLAHTIRIETHAEPHVGRPHRRRNLRYRLGKALVLAGSRVMGRSVDVRDLVQPA